MHAHQLEPIGGPRARLGTCPELTFERGAATHGERFLSELLMWSLGFFV
jgi:hypothetical protein